MPTARAVAQQERTQKALVLRKAGYAWNAIGAQLGITPQAANQLVQRALKATLREATDDLRTLEAERLDDMLRPLYAQAIKGNQGAADRVLRIMERRAKLLGLDAPVRNEVSGPGGSPVRVEEMNLSDSERAERITALLDRARARATGQAAGDDADVLAGRAPEPDTA